VIRLKSLVEFLLIKLSHGYAKTNEIRLETMGNPKKLGVFLNYDKRQHMDMAVQDLQRQFKDAMKREIPF
jgi:hypothetical protein